MSFSSYLFSFTPHVHVRAVGYVIGADDSINSDIHKAALARLSEIELDYCLLDVEKEIIFLRKVAVVQNGWVKAAFVILCRTINTTSTYTSMVGHIQDVQSQYQELSQNWRCSF